MWGSVLQSDVVCGSVLHCVAVWCILLQCVAVYYSLLQFVAVCCSLLYSVVFEVVCCILLQCVAVYYSLLQSVAVGLDKRTSSLAEQMARFLKSQFYCKFVVENRVLGLRLRNFNNLILMPK